jgi:AAA lid domain-containing protein/ATPase family protein associated with various cellular activities (AAA)
MGADPPRQAARPPSTPTLAEAVDALARMAQTAGVDPQAARDEGLSLAAAVAESAPGAAADWTQASGDQASTQDFFDAASRGRRWRGSPTTTLSALAAQDPARAAQYAALLAEVASAACQLGEPTMRVIGNASVAAAAQLGAVQHGAHTSSPHAPQPPGGPDPVATAPAEAPEEPEPTPEQPERSLEELLAELDGLIGLQAVKREIHRQVALLRVEKLRLEAGLRSATLTRHLVFTGNPGTGKTTVARLVSGIYRALELLSRGQLVEVDRSELVAGYLGQTATKTADAVASAAGGVLFIDEAYSLTGLGPQGDQYGQEAVDTLVKEMEDRRDDLVVIVAGYPAPMRTFIGANPGLASRFRTTIEFADYTDDELVEILHQLAAGADYEIVPEAVERFRELLGRTPRGETFGNGRFARNALESAIGHQAWRLRDVAAPTTDQLRELIARDFDEDPLEAEPENEPENEPGLPTPTPGGDDDASREAGTPDRGPMSGGSS